MPLVFAVLVLIMALLLVLFALNVLLVAKDREVGLGRGMPVMLRSSVCACCVPEVRSDAE